MPFSLLAKTTLTSSTKVCEKGGYSLSLLVYHLVQLSCPPSSQRSTHEIICRAGPHIVVLGQVKPKVLLDVITIANHLLVDFKAHDKVIVGSPRDDMAISHEAQQSAVHRKILEVHRAEGGISESDHVPQDVGAAWRIRGVVIVCLCSMVMAMGRLRLRTEEAHAPIPSRSAVGVIVLSVIVWTGKLKAGELGGILAYQVLGVGERGKPWQ